MDPADSATRLRQQITAAGRTVETLTTEEAVGFMLDFYRQVRADDCLLDEEGDMLLFQFGVHDWGEGETFEFDITRQFTAPGTEDEDGMSQLSLTLHFPVTDALRAFNDNEWCASPDEADDFERLIRDHAVTKAVTSLKPSEITLDWTPI